MPIADLFDQILNAKCSIWKKGGSGIVDGYGIESQILILVKEGVPCRADPGPGKELASDVAFGIQEYTFYMRPVTVDDPPVPLNIHHWLQLNFVEGQALIDPPDPNGTMYDIKNIKRLSGWPQAKNANTDPGLIGHHLEIETKLIEP